MALMVQDQLEGGRIARLILAGNTLAMPVKGEDDHKIVSTAISASQVAWNRLIMAETVQRISPRPTVIASH